MKAKILLVLFAVGLGTAVRADDSPHPVDVAGKVTSLLGGKPPHVVNSSVGNNAPILHFQGDGGLDIEIQRNSGSLKSLYWESEATKSTKIRFRMEQCRHSSEAFLTHFFPLPEFSLTSSKLSDHGSAGKLYEFVWSKKIGDLRLPIFIRVETSAFDQKIVSLISVNSGFNRQDVKDFKKLSLEEIKKSLPFLANPVIKSTDYFITPLPMQFVACDISASGAVLKNSVGLTEGEKVSGSFEIEVKSKEIINFRIRSSTTSAANPSPKSLTSSDIYPVWDRSRLYFASERFLDAGNLQKNREIATESKEKHDKPYHFSVSYQNEKKVLVAVISCYRTTHKFDISSEGSLVMEVQGALWTFNMDGSRLARIYYPLVVSRSDPSWSPNGEWLAMAGTHSAYDGTGGDDRDIFICSVSPKASLNSAKENYCVALLPGTDILPVWSPAGDSIVFCHQENPQKWSLYSVNVKDLIGHGIKAIPQKIDGLTGNPQRLSFFPGGKRVLVGYEIAEKSSPLPEVIELASGKRVVLKLNHLRDTDASKTSLSGVRDIVLSPDGKKMAFSALRWSGKLNEAGAFCIYTCNLDGTELRRVTQPSQDLLIARKYASPGVTALNAWEKLQPKPPSVVALDYNDPKTPGTPGYLKELQRKNEADRIAKDKAYNEKMGFKLRGSDAPAQNPAPLPAAPAPLITMPPAPVGPMAPW